MPRYMKGGEWLQRWKGGCDSAFETFYAHLRKMHRGAISWGADLSGIAPTVLNANADAVCNTGVWTTAILSQSGGTPVPISQRTDNDFYTIIMGVLSLVATAGTLSALKLSYALVSGTPISSIALDFNIVNGSFTLTDPAYVPFVISGPLSQAVYRGAGATPLIELMPTGDTVTMSAAFSYALFQLAVGVE